MLGGVEGERNREESGGREIRREGGRKEGRKGDREIGSDLHSSNVSIFVTNLSASRERVVELTSSDTVSVPVVETREEGSEG